MTSEAEYRTKVTGYWKMYSPTVESMMFSSEAKIIKGDEEREILSSLPDFKGKKVLEIAAGIGRFTGQVASVAGHVTAVDFMADYLEENKKQNGHHRNITFKCSDIMMADFPAGSFDLVFSNWIFMYLNDVETKTLCDNVLKWLAPGGHFFLRESCYGPIGNLNKADNPSVYRTPLQYYEALQSATSPEGGAAFRVLRGKSLLKYIQYYGNPTQLCFLSERVSKDALQKSPPGGRSSQRQEVNLDTILLRERIFGSNWHCTGGEAVNKDLCTTLGLRPGQRVLDVGCGTGANSFFMARHYGANVHGIDQSPFMIHLAIDRQRGLDTNVKKRIQFEMGDILTADLGENVYDVIYSREGFSNVQDKKALFKKLHKCLKTGGILFFTDYCKGPAPETQDFVESVRKNRNSSLVAESCYCQELEASGFTSVQTDGRRESFLKTLQRELESFVSAKEAISEDFSPESYEGLVKRWSDKILWTKRSQLVWSSFSGRK